MDKFSKKIFPNNIKIARTELGLTQEEFAIKIGLSKTNISGWETGKAFPSEKVLNNIESVFGIRKDFLLLGDGDILSN